MATALKYKQELDPAKPLNERWGGRFLTQPEVDDMFERVRLGEYEYVAMNLEHHVREHHVAGGFEPVAMTDGEALELFETAHDLRQIAEKATELADQVEFGVRYLLDAKRQAGDAS